MSIVSFENSVHLLHLLKYEIKQCFQLIHRGSLSWRVYLYFFTLETTEAMVVKSIMLWSVTNEFKHNIKTYALHRNSYSGQKFPSVYRPSFPYSLPPWTKHIAIIKSVDYSLNLHNQITSFPKLAQFHLIITIYPTFFLLITIWWSIWNFERHSKFRGEYRIPDRSTDTYYLNYNKITTSNTQSRRI